MMVLAKPFKSIQVSQVYMHAHKEKQNNQIDLPPCSVDISEASYNSIIKPLHFPVRRNDDIKKLHDHPLIAKIPTVKCFVNESHYRDECQKSDYIQRQQFQQSCIIGR